MILQEAKDRTARLYGWPDYKSIGVVALHATKATYKDMSIEAKWLNNEVRVLDRAKNPDSTPETLWCLTDMQRAKNLFIDEQRSCLLFITRTNDFNCYKISDDGKLEEVYAHMPVDLPILSFAVNKKCTIMAVIVGDEYQQVFGYNIDSGHKLWEIGLKGGYQTSALVAPDKFDFTTNFGNKGAEPYVFFDEMDNIYIGDSCQRTQVFDKHQQFARSNKGRSNLFNSFDKEHIADEAAELYANSLREDVIIEILEKSESHFVSNVGGNNNSKSIVDIKDILEISDKYYPAQTATN